MLYSVNPLYPQSAKYFASRYLFTIQTLLQPHIQLVFLRSKFHEIYYLYPSVSMIRLTLFQNYCHLPEPEYLINHLTYLTGFDNVSVQYAYRLAAISKHILSLHPK